jgi:hypothetical protein
MQRHHVPFEHIDLWVPSFVPSSGVESAEGTSCRLCYAGNATVDLQVAQDGKCTFTFARQKIILTCSHSATTVKNFLLTLAVVCQVEFIKVVCPLGNRAS